MTKPQAAALGAAASMTYGREVTLSDKRTIRVSLIGGEIRVDPPVAVEALKPSDKQLVTQALAAAERLRISNGQAGSPPMMTRSDPGQRPAPSPEERRQPQVGGRGTRALAITPDSYDAENHTVEVVLSTGAAVQRFYFIEELEISETAVDLSRVAGGVCPVLDTHNSEELEAQIGRIIAARIDGANLVGVIQFDQTTAGQEIEGRVARREIRAVSIGYQVTSWTITTNTTNAELDTWRATAWQLLEGSFVSVPADPNAVVRSAPGTVQHGTTEEEDDMRRNLPGGAAAAAPAPTTPAATTTVVVEPSGQTRTEPNNDTGAAPAPVVAATEPVRTTTIPASRIMDMCARSPALGSEFAAELIRTNEATPFDEATLLSRVNERLISSRPTIDARAGATGTESDGYRAAVEDAIELRTNPGLTATMEPARLQAAREFRGMTLMEMSRDYLQRTGISTGGMGRLDIAGAALGLRGGALTTSDFAFALANTANKRVRAAFASAPQTFRPIVSTNSLPDFKTVSVIGLGDAPALLYVPENAEFKNGFVADTGMNYRLVTYGRKITISRQAIINDDQGLFGRIPTAFGRQAANLESDVVWGVMLSNPTMPDGLSMFHANHGNLGAGGPINITNLGLARQAFRSQKSAEGSYISIEPRFLIVGPAKEVEAQQALTAVLAAQNSNVNVFAGSLTLIVEPRITDNSWYLAADPADFDTIVLAHLAGQEELFLDSRVGFDVDGIETKARLDVGAAAIDYRGFYKSPAY